MTAGSDDDDLPLHEEAEARSSWRGGETHIEGEGDSGPASEIDDAAQGDGHVGGSTEDGLRNALAQRPPD